MGGVWGREEWGIPPNKRFYLLSAEGCNCGSAAIGQLKAGLEGLPVRCRWGAGGWGWVGVGTVQSGLF
ncbi:hypothetical protein [Kamptonema formosum]|uniref:hypothetical protein n=1 Tax=Kamptonema formosum TaxID=331992 RepID=UPI0012DD4B71|nr:hypothetical protein [Oscillatoria sp. PCC 10802]